MDREKIIENMNTAKAVLCNPNMVTPEMYIKIGQTISDALSLLKKQEAILLENQHKPYGINTNANSPWISRCPKCGKKIEGRQTRYCKYCGQAVKWDEFDRFHHKNWFCADGKRKDDDA